MRTNNHSHKFITLFILALLTILGIGSICIGTSSCGFFFNNKKTDHKITLTWENNINTISGTHKSCELKGLVEDDHEDSITWDYDATNIDAVTITPNGNIITFTLDESKTVNSKIVLPITANCTHENIKETTTLNISPYTAPNYDYVITLDKTSVALTQANCVSKNNPIAVNATITKKDGSSVASTEKVTWALQSSTLPSYVNVDSTSVNNKISFQLIDNVETSANTYVYNVSYADGNGKVALNKTFSLTTQNWEYWDPTWIPKNELNINNNKLIGLIANADISIYTTLHIPKEITEIGDRAFLSSTSTSSDTSLSPNIVNLDFGSNSSLEKIGNEAFYKAPFTNDLITPSKLTSIGTDCFYRCIGVKKINMNASTQLKKISAGAFSDFVALENIVLPPNLEELSDPNTAGLGVFSLTGSSGESKLVGDLVLPASLKKIGSQAFARGVGTTTQLADLKVDFSHCTNLTTIGPSAFVGLKNLTCENGSTVLTIPSSVTQMGGTGTNGLGYCFSQCERITKVILPSSLNASNFKNAIFYRCTNLEEVTIQSNTMYGYNKSSEAQPFGKWLSGTKIIDISGNAIGGKVLVPNALLTQYQNNSDWPSGTNFVGF